MALPFCLFCFSRSFGLKIFVSVIFTWPDMTKQVLAELALTLAQLVSRNSVWFWFRIPSGSRGVSGFLSFWAKSPANVSSASTLKRSKGCREGLREGLKPFTDVVMPVFVSGFVIFEEDTSPSCAHLCRLNFQVVQIGTQLRVCCRRPLMESMIKWNGDIRNKAYLV